jgi:hypothetical protein
MMGKIWITFRLLGGPSKFYGQIESHDFEDLGVRPVRVFNPLVATVVAERGMIEGATNVNTRIQPLLDLSDYTEHFMWVNSQQIFSWQKVNVAKAVSTLEEIAKQLEEELRAKAQEKIETAL